MAGQRKNMTSLAVMAAAAAAALACGNRYIPGSGNRLSGGGAAWEAETSEIAAGENLEDDLQGKAGNSAEAGSGAGEADGNGAGIKQERPKLPVTEAEETLLRGIYEALEAGDRERAARILIGNPEQLRVLSDKTLQGDLYLFFAEDYKGEREYRMEPVERAEARRGLVLAKFNTVFYGEFAGGMPEGHVLAVQTVVLDHPRYTFSEGRWAGGKMNGEGTTGYRYYEGKPEGGFASSEKQGGFRENLMEGELTYRVDNGSGRILSWKLAAKDGVTVLDDRWNHYPDRQEYMLMSEEDTDRAFVIPEAAKDSVRWNNLILWGE